MLHWAPVWVALLLFWQVSTLGLKPALAEEARLEQETLSVEERHERTKTEFEALEDEAEAWQDPVYRERRRRMLKSSQPKAANKPAGTPGQ
ncbi:MAG: hypothetical protein O2816_10720 [Planctomycetota bacterium]|nr:hypothetical protein [Planctomycetota bacterium]